MILFNYHSELLQCNNSINTSDWEHHEHNIDSMECIVIHHKRKSGTLHTNPWPEKFQQNLGWRRWTNSVDLLLTNSSFEKMLLTRSVHRLRLRRASSMGGCGRLLVPAATCSSRSSVRMQLKMGTSSMSTLLSVPKVKSSGLRMAIGGMQQKVKSYYRLLWLYKHFYYCNYYNYH